jgi:hypothetical protein
MTSLKFEAKFLIYKQYLRTRCKSRFKKIQMFLLKIKFFLYVLDYFDALISKIILKNKKILF